MKWLYCRARKSAMRGLLLPLMLASAEVQGGAFFYQFTNVFGGTKPDGSPAWVSTFFSDVAPGTVQLKISAKGLSGGEFLSAMFFNLDPSLNPAKLSFTYAGGSGGFTLPTIKEGANDFKADGQGKFDIDFTFSQKAGHEFTENDYVIFDVTSSTVKLVASDFDFLSTAAGGGSQFLAAAEIACIPGTCNTTTTGWVAPGGIATAPEPPGITLFALGGGLGMAAVLRRRRAKSAQVTSP